MLYRNATKGLPVLWLEKRETIHLTDFTWTEEVPDQSHMIKSYIPAIPPSFDAVVYPDDVKRIGPMGIKPCDHLVVTKTDGTALKLVIHAIDFEIIQDRMRLYGSQVHYTDNNSNLPTMAEETPKLVITTADMLKAMGWEMDREWAVITERYHNHFLSKDVSIFVCPKCSEEKRLPIFGKCKCPCGAHLFLHERDVMTQYAEWKKQQ